MNSVFFSYESFAHAVSGAAGSAAAMMVFYPLDTARLTLQVDEKRKSKSAHTVLGEIFKEGGLSGLYTGWFAVIYTLCISNFFYFYCFHSFKAIWLNEKQATTSNDLLAGFAAGVVSVLLTSPLWVVNTRLKVQGLRCYSKDVLPTRYSGFMDAIVQITSQEGVAALWSGTFTSLLLVSNPAIQFMVYEGLKRHLRWIVSRELSSVEFFIIGALAKAVATIVTYPLQTIQSILRLPQYQRSDEKLNILSSVKVFKCQLLRRVRNDGVLGLFSGLEAKLLQTVLTAALMFLIYENIVSCTFRVMGLSKSF
ncbi:peroxisomal membrane protein PMP34-like isoform X1 [Takifugu rubripes]|nr:peroxisomal membrane protein PMP34-like isoform X1 [Takifugu rubripes]